MGLFASAFSRISIFRKFMICLFKHFLQKQICCAILRWHGQRFWEQDQQVHHCSRGNFKKKKNSKTVVSETGFLKVSKRWKKQERRVKEKAHSIWSSSTSITQFFMKNYNFQHKFRTLSKRKRVISGSSCSSPPASASTILLPPLLREPWSLRRQNPRIPFLKIRKFMNYEFGKFKFRKNIPTLRFFAGGASELASAGRLFPLWPFSFGLRPEIVDFENRYSENRKIRDRTVVGLLFFIGGHFVFLYSQNVLLRKQKSRPLGRWSKSTWSASKKPQK